MTGMVPGPAVLACPWGFGELCDLIRSMADTMSSVSDLVRDPFLWLAHHLFPHDFLDLLGGQLDPGTDDNAYARLYRGMTPAGLAVAGIAATVRVARAVYADGITVSHLVADNLLRFGAGSLAVAAPTPARLTGDGLPVAWQLLRLGTNASVGIARGCIGLLSSSSVFAADVSPRGLVGRFAALLGLSTIPVFGFFFAIILILVGVGIVYMAMIMVLRSIMLAFAVAAAPVCIATVCFDHRNRFFQWWLELASGALLIPVVLASILAITAGFAMRFDDISASFLPVTGVLLGGMWFAGKAVHQLTWRHFSHGGITGALTALSTTVMAAPSIAGQASSLLAMAGHAPRPGGWLDSLGGAPRMRGSGATGSPGVESTMPEPAPLAALAADLAGTAVTASRLAEAGANSGADFAAWLGPGSELRGAGPAFNRAAGASVGLFAETPAGMGLVRDATSHLAPSVTMPERVMHYSRAISRDPSAGAAVAAAAVGSLLGGRLPDLSPTLATAGDPHAHPG